MRSRRALLALVTVVAGLSFVVAPLSWRRRSEKNQNSDHLQFESFLQRSENEREMGSNITVVTASVSLFVPFVEPLVERKTENSTFGVEAVCSFPPTLEGLSFSNSGKAGFSLGVPLVYPTVIDVGGGFVFLFALSDGYRRVRLWVSDDYGGAFVEPRIDLGKELGDCFNDLFEPNEEPETFFFSPTLDARVVTGVGGNSGGIFPREELVSVARRLFESRDSESPCYSGSSAFSGKRLDAAWLRDAPWKAAASTGRDEYGGFALGSHDGVFWFPVASVFFPTPSPRLAYNDGFWNLLWDRQTACYRNYFRFNFAMGARSIQQSESCGSNFSAWTPPTELDLHFVGGERGVWEEFYSIAMDAGLAASAGIMGTVLRMQNDGVRSKNETFLALKPSLGMDLAPVALDPATGKMHYVCGSNASYITKEMVPTATPEPLQNRYALFHTRGFVERGDRTLFFVQAGPHMKRFRLYRFSVPRNRLGGVRDTGETQSARVQTKSFHVPGNVSVANLVFDIRPGGRVRVGFVQNDVAVRGMSLAEALTVEHSGQLCWGSTAQPRCSVSAIANTRVAVVAVFTGASIFGLEFSE
jgi:hypothetical protein